MNKVNTKNTLLIFDIKTEADFISTHLTQGGLKVNSANDFEQALQMVKRLKPEIIIVNMTDKKNEVDIFYSKVKLILINDFLFLNIENPNHPIKNILKKENKNQIENEKVNSTSITINKLIRSKSLLSILHNMLLE